MRQGQPQQEESLCALPLQPQGRRTAGSSSGNRKPRLLTGQELMFFSGTRLTLKLYAGSPLVPGPFVAPSPHNPWLRPRPSRDLTITPVTGDATLSG